MVLSLRVMVRPWKSVSHRFGDNILASIVSSAPIFNSTIVVAAPLLNNLDAIPTHRKWISAITPGKRWKKLTKEKQTSLALLLIKAVGDFGDDNLKKASDAPA